TCTFDRPGVAYDSLGVATPVGLATDLMTPRAIEKILMETLRRAHVGPRVILVGHSLGGMDAVRFGADYPSLVAGAVLLDPSAPATLTDPVDRRAVAAVGLAPDASAAEIRAVQHWPPVPFIVLTRDLNKAVATGALTPARAQAGS